MTEERINVIKLLKDIGITTAEREEFLYHYRSKILLLQKIKNREELDKIKLSMNSFVNNEILDNFTMDDETRKGARTIIAQHITQIISNRKNDSFANLLVNLLSNYLNALKFDPTKHVVLMYTDNQYWDHVNAIDVTNLEENVKLIIDAYKNEDAEGLHKNGIVVSKGDTPYRLEDFKIKTNKNFEKEKYNQKVSEYRRQTEQTYEQSKLTPQEKRKLIDEKVRQYKASLE